VAIYSTEEVLERRISGSFCSFLVKHTGNCFCIIVGTPIVNKLFSQSQNQAKLGLPLPYGNTASGFSFCFGGGLHLQSVQFRIFSNPMDVSVARWASCRSRGLSLFLRRGCSEFHSLMPSVVFLFFSDIVAVCSLCPLRPFFLPGASLLSGFLTQLAVLPLYGDSSPLFWRRQIFAAVHNLGPNFPGNVALTPCYCCTAGHLPTGGSQLPSASPIPSG
jgi:hypothetical protein